MDVPIFTLTCRDRSETNDCMLFLAYGNTGNPDGGDEFSRLMTCYHCPRAKKIFFPAYDHRRRFGIRKGRDSRKIDEWLKVRTKDDEFLKRVKNTCKQA